MHYKHLFLSNLSLNSNLKRQSKARSQTFHVDTLVAGAFVVLARTLLLKQAGICGRRDSSQQNAEWQKDAQEVEACKFVVKVWAGRVVEGEVVAG